MNKKDVKIIMNLRQNARDSLSEISRKTKIPISTIFDRLKLGKEKYIKKFTCLVDFNQFGFGCQVHIVVRVKKDQRKSIKEFLLRQQNTNSVYKINNGYDFLIDCIFRNVKEVEEFIDVFETKFKVYEKNIYYIIEEISKETFMNDCKHVELAMQKK